MRRQQDEWLPTVTERKKSMTTHELIMQYVTYGTATVAAAAKKEWKEEDHPRKADGKFARKTGGDIAVEISWDDPSDVERHFAAQVQEVVSDIPKLLTKNVSKITIVPYTGDEFGELRGYDAKYVIPTKEIMLNENVKEEHIREIIYHELGHVLMDHATADQRYDWTSAVYDGGLTPISRNTEKAEEMDRYYTEEAKKDLDGMRRVTQELKTNGDAYPEGSARYAELVAEYRDIIDTLHLSKADIQNGDLDRYAARHHYNLKDIYANEMMADLFMFTSGKSKRSHDGPAMYDALVQFERIFGDDILEVEGRE